MACAQQQGLCQGCSLFVVGDDDQLEVLLLPPGEHDVAQGLCQAAAVGLIQVGGGLVQGQDAAIQAEGLCQRQPDDQARQHLHWTGPFAITVEAVKTKARVLCWAATKLLLEIFISCLDGRWGNQSQSQIPTLQAESLSQRPCDDEAHQHLLPFTFYFCLPLILCEGSQDRSRILCRASARLLMRASSRSCPSYANILHSMRRLLARARRTIIQHQQLRQQLVKVWAEAACGPSNTSSCVNSWSKFGLRLLVGPASTILPSLWQRVPASARCMTQGSAIIIGCCRPWSLPSPAMSWSGVLNAGLTLACRHSTLHKHRH